MTRNRVAIITMHRGNNFGSALQVYALCEYLKAQECDPVVIDYVPQRCTLSYQFRMAFSNLIKNHSIAGLYNFVRSALILFDNTRCFSRFFRRHMPKTASLSKKQLATASIEADVYMTGSDQVWNSVHNGGIDEAFFLTFAPQSAKLISYAASFGKEALDDWEKAPTRTLLQRYAAISVREKSGEQVLESIGLKGHTVLDPTFLLDAADWGKRIIPHNEADDYVLIYSVEPDKQGVINIARAIADRLGAKVFMVEWGRKPYVGVDKMISLPSPLTLMDYFRKARYVVASSFHGTALSVNMGKEFISVAPAKFNTRVKSLLGQLGLSGRMIPPEDFDVDKFLEPIDYESVNAKLESLRQASKQFLRNNL